MARAGCSHNAHRKARPLLKCPRPSSFDVHIGDEHHAATVIAGNGLDGILVQDSLAGSVRIAGVRIGTSADGLQAIEHFQTERDRTVKRALLMAKGEYDAIRAHPELSKPVAGGATHSHPEQERRADEL